jgi:hypothetical protein
MVVIYIIQEELLMWSVNEDVVGGDTPLKGEVIKACKTLVGKFEGKI